MELEERSLGTLHDLRESGQAVTLVVTSAVRFRGPGETHPFVFADKWSVVMRGFRGRGFRDSVSAAGGGWWVLRVVCGVLWMAWEYPIRSQHSSR